MYFVLVSFFHTENNRNKIILVYAFVKDGKGIIT